jgi:hypothetical protein
LAVLAAVAAELLIRDVSEAFSYKFNCRDLEEIIGKLHRNKGQGPRVRKDEG